MYDNYMMIIYIREEPPPEKRHTHTKKKIDREDLKTTYHSSVKILKLDTKIHHTPEKEQFHNFWIEGRMSNRMEIDGKFSSLLHYLLSHILQ